MFQTCDGTATKRRVTMRKNITGYVNTYTIGKFLYNRQKGKFLPLFESRDIKIPEVNLICITNSINLL